MFSKSPAAIVKNRPETDLHFLEFLQGKEHTLRRLADRDLQQRTSWGLEATKAVLNLDDIGLWIIRTVVCGYPKVLAPGLLELHTHQCCHRMRLG